MRFLRRQRCGGERRGNEQQRQPHDTSSVTVLSVRESGPTMMSNAPGSTTRFMRSEEHTSELQSLMRIPYPVFSWKKKKHIKPKSYSYDKVLHNTYYHNHI